MGVSMNGLSSLYSSDYLSDTASANKVENSIKSGTTNQSDDKLMSVCKEFESYLVEQMYKAMKKSVPEEDKKDMMFSTSTTDYYQDMLTQEYASMTTEQGGLGIAKVLYDSMKRNYNITE